MSKYYIPFTNDLARVAPYMRPNTITALIADLEDAASDGARL